jgi:hypothetical protein
LFGAKTPPDHVRPPSEETLVAIRSAAMSL